MYKELGNKPSIPALEEEILEFWEKQNIFVKSIETRDRDKPFVFYEGPPTANGRPGIHHVLARTVKDLVCRYKTMNGYRVERKAGWDTHGLPVEIEVEKMLNIESKDQIVEYGVEKFNEKCRESVWKYKSEWDELTRRIGYWVDLSDPYITYEDNYIESVWWILSELWRKNLIYLGHKILPYCPRCETPLSSHEVAQGYKDVSDPSIYVKMPLLNDPDTSFLVWTTTPWTLISNVALALSPELDYVLVEHEGEKLILAKDRLSVLEGEYKIRQTYKGAELARQKYKRLFDYLPVDKNAFYTITADFVTADDGSGIVHLAPAFGEDDNQAGQKHDLPFLQPIDKSGNFDERITDYAGLFFKKADPKITNRLKEDGKLYKSETHKHAYPHCWRCDSPLIYYAYESWYIRTTKIKDRLMHHNDSVSWFPKEVGEGRFGEWLKNNVDWSLSRDRFWGTPLPIWQCESCDETICVGSREELKKKAGVEVIKDLHKPHVDDLTISCEKCKGVMRRVPEVIDVWFDSGSMPIAQWHYPFENKELFEKKFPADFISEGVDQTRGWFYSLLAIAVLLFDKPCYKSCLSTDMILDKKGQKMSKSKGNTVDPFSITEKYGADPARWYLMAVSPPWLPTRFDEAGVGETVRKFFNTLLNTYGFFAMYANIDKFSYNPDKRIAIDKRAEIDQWIISTLNKLVAQVDDLWKRYEITKIARAISNFVIDDVSNWYVRRNRRRFWKAELGEDKIAAYQTLYEALHTVSRLIAPLAPFMSEEVFRNLSSGGESVAESVHLDFYPDPKESSFAYRNETLEKRMALLRSVVNVGRALRNDANTRVRQPLPRLVVVPGSDSEKEQIAQMSDLVREELNVKAVEFANSADELMMRKAAPDFKKLGPKFGKTVKPVAEWIRNLSSDDVARLQNEGVLQHDLNGEKVEILPSDVQISVDGKNGLIASMDGQVPVALDTTLNDDLRKEGLAREIVNRIQNMRKDAGFDIVDRIKVGVQASENVREAILMLESYIKNETLAEQIVFDLSRQDAVKEWNVNDEVLSIAIQKLNQ